MKGCLKAIGCLTVLIFATLALTWFSRDWWLPKTGLTVPPQVAAATWRAPGNALRADSALRRMTRKGGPAFANIEPNDLLAYIVRESRGMIPRTADSLQAAVVGDRFYLRFRVRTADLGSDILGMMKYVVNERELVMFGGPLRVIRPGLSELQVKDVSLRTMRLPQMTIPTVLRQIGIEHQSGLSDDGVPLATPPYIGDVRVANGRITVYRKP